MITTTMGPPIINYKPFMTKMSLNTITICDEIELPP